LRPLKLIISAFGPFRETQVIDFTLLGEQPLFLINGVTGAGKTTILDAICFALYGKTTGDEREASQMRSDGADGDVLTFVEFSFSLKNQFYRMKRVPEQVRPKTVGEGVTKQGAQAQLWLVDSHGEEIKVLVSQKVTDANREIESLTGLNADQFRQVMVLPQGQFRKLLMADSKDREAIFSQLFSTSIYKRIENQLKDQALVLKREVGDLLRLKEGILQSLNLDNEAGLSEQIKLLSEQEQQANTHNKEFKIKLVKLNNQYEQAKSLHKSVQKLDQLEQQQRELQQQKNHIVSVKQQQLRAQEAQKILPAYQDYRGVADKIPQAQKDLSEQMDVVEQSLLKLQECEKAQQVSPTLRKDLDTIKADLIEFKRFSNDAIELSQLQKSLELAVVEQESAKKHTDNATENIAKLHTEKSCVIESIAKIKEDVLKLADPSVSLLAATQKIQQLQEIATLQQQQASLREQQATLKSNGAKVRENKDAAVALVTQLQMQWHLSQAQILAQQLIDHQPCPVCGSLEHPQKAVSEQPLVTLDDIEKAQKSAEQWALKLDGELDIYYKNDAELKALKEQEKQRKAAFLADDPQVKTSISYWHSVAEKAQTDIVLLGDYKIRQQLAEKKITQLDSLHEEASSLYQQSQKMLAESDKKVAVISSELTKCSANLPQAYQRAGALEQAIQSHIQLQKNTEQQLEQLAQDFVSSEKNHQAAVFKNEALMQLVSDLSVQSASLLIAWNEALTGSIFDEQVDYLQAVVSLSEQQKIALEISEFELKRGEIASAIKTQKEMIGEQQLPQLSLMQQQLAQLEADQQNAENQWLTIDKQLSQFKHSALQISKAAQKNKALEVRYAVVGTLSDVANGQSANKVSLQRFVLSALLDDVLIEASARLQIMSKGRYHLLRKEERAKGNKASGLELEVDDAYTGKVRSVSTLSGGESFMAALSLALGVSGVVQAHAGGIVLDTLFIDEGFGSLDSEALDLAVRTLVDLQRHGRMIGVISHVSELKEQISTRIDIISDQQGSRIQLVS